MLVRIVGVVAGILAGVAIVFGVETVGHHLYPPPAGLNVQDPRQLETLIAQMPAGALAMVVAGWVLGAFGGGLVGGLVGRDLRVSLTVGFLLMLGGVMTLLEIPHPVWMWAVGVVAPIPAAALGGRVSGAVMMTGQPV